MVAAKQEAGKTGDGSVSCLQISMGRLRDAYETGRITSG